MAPRPRHVLAGASLALVAGAVWAQTIECATACTVTVVHDFSADTLTPERIADYMALFGAFLGAAVVVLCAKALYNRFRIDHDPA